LALLLHIVFFPDTVYIW